MPKRDCNVASDRLSTQFSRAMVSSAGLPVMTNDTHTATATVGTGVGIGVLGAAVVVVVVVVPFDVEAGALVVFGTDVDVVMPLALVDDEGRSEDVVAVEAVVVLGAVVVVVELSFTSIASKFR